MNSRLKMRKNVSDVMKVVNPTQKQRLLENAYNVKLSDQDSKDCVTSPKGAIWSRRKASTEIESKVSEILNKKDGIEGRPFHPLGFNRMTPSTHVQDIPFMNNKFDYKMKRSFNQYIHEGTISNKKNPKMVFQSRRNSVVA